MIDLASIKLNSLRQDEISKLTAKFVANGGEIEILEGFSPFPQRPRRDTKILRDNSAPPERPSSETLKGMVNNRFKKNEVEPTSRIFELATQYNLAQVAGNLTLTPDRMNRIRKIDSTSAPKNSLAQVLNNALARAN